jgi:cation diffusion facilitator CzcD-associated flavoprotein CzcO
LSLAAHLHGRGISHRVFGAPMDNWLNHMPEGMFLKSEGFASSIADPQDRFTLREYCRQAGRPYADIGSPVDIETFRGYGSWFQATAVPQAEPVNVELLERTPGDGFELLLYRGETARARRVVIACGLTHFPYVPPELRGLPAEMLSHSFDHRDLRRFAGRDVTVIGQGQSALETAVLLHEAGATARVVGRSSIVRWNGVPWVGPRPLGRRLRAPRSGLGDGWRIWYYAHAGRSFASLPRRLRVRIVRQALGPAGSWWLRDRFEPHVPVLLGHRLVSAESSDGRVRMRAMRLGAGEASVETDHVIAATGYRVDISHMPFLGSEVRREIQNHGGDPVLSHHLESSVPGLYFTGLAAARTLGPVMRFVCGTGIAARRVTRHLAAV